jgi:subtilisin family serine protease
MEDNGTNKGATDFSSAGPTNDFRIKPEVCGPGENLGVAAWVSDEPDATDIYYVNSGTSFASPAVAGGVALLQQLHKKTFDVYMDGATMKALLCHTADDITDWAGQDITGPDVKTGYGAVNLEKAAQLIDKDEKESLSIHNFELDQGETETIFFQTTAVGELLTATLSWYDPPAAFYATNALINDLDLRITQEDTTYLPWALPTTAQQAVAVLADNTRDNLEKVVVSGPLGGHYKITVSHKGSLQRLNQSGEFENTTQKGALVLSGPGIFTKSEQELEEITSVNSFLVAPMPAKESFTISALDNTLFFKTLVIFDLSGREIARKTRNSFSLKSAIFDVSNIQSGIYVLGIETNSKTLFKKILVQ